MAKINKAQCVLFDLLRGERVDQKTVIKKYAAYRLSSIIGVLREKGLSISTLNPDKALQMGIINLQEYTIHDCPKYGFYYVAPDERTRYMNSHNIKLVA